MSAETALGIPLILENVFQNLNRENLLRCRLVDALWNEEACKILQHEQMKLKTIPCLTTFNDIFKSSLDGISLAPSNFNFELRDRSVDLQLLEKEMERFVQIAGDQVKELDICVCINESNGDIVTLLQVLICRCFPNLNKVELSVIFGRFYHTEESSAVPMHIQSRLIPCKNKCLANLEELVIRIYSNSFYNTDPPVCNRIVTFTSELLSNAVQLNSFFLQFSCSSANLQIEKSLIKAILPNLLPPTLKQITIYPELTSKECICAIAQHPTLALDDIGIYRIDTSKVTQSDLKHLLNRYRSTLQVLELDFTGPSQMNLPLEVNLNKLTWLRVENIEGIIEWEKLPAIEDVELWYLSIVEIIPHVLSYLLYESTQQSLEIQWNSKLQSVFIAQITEDGPFQLPDPSTITILRGNRKLVTFQITKSHLRGQISNENISAKYLHSLASHPIHFPIQKLGIAFDAHFVIPSDLQQFLNRYQESLREMELDFTIPLDNFCFPLGVHLKKLIALTLNNFQGSFEWRKLPKLKHVKLDCHSLRAIVPSIVATPHDCKIDSMECFWVPEQNHHENDLLISVFKDLAPCLLCNLTRLKIDQNCIAPLSVIFGWCRNLKHLELVRCRGVTDELLCGTGKSLLPVIFREDEDDSFLDPQIFPYIGDLKELQYLRLEIDDVDENANAVSAISLICGIIDCRKLETLILQCPNVSYKRSNRILKGAKLEYLKKVWVKGRCIFLER